MLHAVALQYFIHFLSHRRLSRERRRADGRLEINYGVCKNPGSHPLFKNPGFKLIKNPGIKNG
jgi:hypothetical protein